MAPQRQKGSARITHAPVCWANSLGVILTPGPAQVHNLEKMRRPSVYPANPLALSAVMLFSAGRARPARFLEYPELELSNDLAENSMCPGVLGRRNWIQNRERADTRALGLSTYGSFLPPKGSLRSSLPPVFLGKAVRLIGTFFPWGAFPDASLVASGSSAAPHTSLPAAP